MKQYKIAFANGKSAPIRKDARTIRNCYAIGREERPDQTAEQRASLLALLIGLLGGMMLGPVMSLLMVWSGELLPLGIFAGLAGVTLIFSAYPVYCRVLQRERDLIEPELCRLTDGLTGGQA